MTHTRAKAALQRFEQKFFFRIFARVDFFTYSQMITLVFSTLLSLSFINST